MVLPAMLAARLADIAAHAWQGRGDFHAQEAVDPFHDAFPVGVHFAVMHVDALARVDAIARSLHPVDLQTGLLEPMPADPLRIGFVAVNGHLVPHQRATASHDPLGIAMDEDQPRLGENAHECGKIEHVLRRLEYPGLA